MESGDTIYQLMAGGAFAVIVIREVLSFVRAFLEKRASPGGQTDSGDIPATLKTINSKLSILLDDRIAMRVMAEHVKTQTDTLKGVAESLTILLERTKTNQ